jgi:hypothetical protein
MKAVAGVLLAALLSACDPITGTGPGTQPDPKRFLHVDAPRHAAVLTLIAGSPATDYQFNYDGYANGSLVVTIPTGWELTVQCENHATVPNSCAVVSGARSTQPVQPDWSTADPVHGLEPGSSGGFKITPAATATYRLASLVPGAEASGMWAALRVTAGGTPSIGAGV